MKRKVCYEGYIVVSDWEEQIFQALTHPIRRCIISYLHEKTFGSFTDLLKCVSIRDNGLLGYHLRSMGELMGYYRSAKKYYLTGVGQVAAELILEIRARMIEPIHTIELPVEVK